MISRQMSESNLKVGKLPYSNLISCRVGPDSGICPISPKGFLKDLRLGGRPVATAPACCGVVAISDRPIPCPVRVHPFVALEPCEPSPADRVNLAADGYTHLVRSRQNQRDWSIALPSPSNSPEWRPKVDEVLSGEFRLINI